MGFTENLHAFKMTLLGFVFCVLTLWFFLVVAFCFRPRKQGDGEDEPPPRSWLLTKMNTCFLVMEGDPEAGAQDDSAGILEVERACERLEPLFQIIETVLNVLSREPKPKIEVGESASIKAEQDALKERLSQLENTISAHEARITELESGTEKQSEGTVMIESHGASIDGSGNSTGADLGARVHALEQLLEDHKDHGALIETHRTRINDLEELSRESQNYALEQSSRAREIEARKEKGLAAELAERRSISPPVPEKSGVKVVAKGKLEPKEERSEIPSSESNDGDAAMTSAPAKGRPKAAATPDSESLDLDDAMTVVVEPGDDDHPDFDGEV